MNQYEAKKESRIERLRERAAKAHGESDSAYRKAQQATAGIEFGQPIPTQSRRHRAWATN